MPETHSSTTNGWPGDALRATAVSRSFAGLHALRSVTLELRRHDESALHAVVETRFSLADGDEARLVSYLELHAEGNPFFATELLRALEEESLLFAVEHHLL